MFNVSFFDILYNVFNFIWNLALHPTVQNLSCHQYLLRSNCIRPIAMNSRFVIIKHYDATSSSKCRSHLLIGPSFYNFAF